MSLKAENMHYGFTLDVWSPGMTYVQNVFKVYFTCIGNVLEMHRNMYWKCAGNAQKLGYRTNRALSIIC